MHANFGKKKKNKKKRYISRTPAAKVSSWEMRLLGRLWTSLTVIGMTGEAKSGQSADDSGGRDGFYGVWPGIIGQRQWVVNKTEGFFFLFHIVI